MFLAPVSCCVTENLMRTYFLVIPYCIAFSFLSLLYLCLRLSFCEQWYLTSISGGIRDFKNVLIKSSEIFTGKMLCGQKVILSQDSKVLANMKNIWYETQLLGNTFFSNCFPGCPERLETAKSCVLVSKGHFQISCWNISCCYVWRFVLVGNCECTFFNCSPSTVMWRGKSCGYTLVFFFLSCASPKQIFEAKDNKHEIRLASWIFSVAEDTCY